MGIRRTEGLVSWRSKSPFESETYPEGIAKRTATTAAYFALDGEIHLGKIIGGNRSNLLELRICRSSVSSVFCFEALSQPTRAIGTGPAPLSNLGDALGC